MLESFFISSAHNINVETGVYHLPLVVLSYVVASFASYTALALAQQLVDAKNIYEKRLSHWGGAFAMGAGIWAMHFIGMLSYKMSMKVEYDFLLTLLSMLFAVTVAYGVLLIVARIQLTLWQILIGAILLGLGISGMHYTGMAAMKMDAKLLYVPGVFFLSIVIAISASAAALWIAFTLVRSSSRYSYLFQIVAALIMGAAICGMHYTGMAASVMIPLAHCRYDPNQDFDVLAICIAIITCMILCIALAIGFSRKMQAEDANELIKKLVASNTDLKRFSYVASHDLQEPLRMISNFTTLIAKEYGDKFNGEGKQYIHLVLESVVRMQSMVEDLQKYAQVNNQATRFVAVNGTAELEQVLDSLSASILEHRAHITHDIMPEFKGNPTQFSILLQYIIANGLKYQPDGGTPQLHIGTKEVDNMWEFSISDNGIGMENDYVEQIFEPFKRLHTWQQYKGTGIGLAVCKKIVENHGGRIWVTSQPGRGSIFYFTLPKL